VSAELLQLGGARRTPLIAQSEASECALACLAMVAGHHGFKTDLIELRQRFALSLNCGRATGPREVAGLGALVRACGS